MLLGLLTCLSTACAPGIGDECASNTECNSQEGAICDVSIPGGYCTVPNCVPNGCPVNSVCVEFDRDNSFCMEACLADSDCRDEHVCREDLGNYGDENYGFCYIASD